MKQKGYTSCTVISALLLLSSISFSDESGHEPPSIGAAVSSTSDLISDITEVGTKGDSKGRRRRRRQNNLDDTAFQSRETNMQAPGMTRYPGPSIGPNAGGNSGPLQDMGGCSQLDGPKNQNISALLNTINAHIKNSQGGKCDALKVSSKSRPGPGNSYSPQNSYGNPGAIPPGIFSGSSPELLGMGGGPESIGPGGGEPLTDAQKIELETKALEELNSFVDSFTALSQATGDSSECLTPALKTSAKQLLISIANSAVTTAGSLYGPLGIAGASIFSKIFSTVAAWIFNRDGDIKKHLDEIQNSERNRIPACDLIQLSYIVGGCNSADKHQLTKEELEKKKNLEKLGREAQENLLSAKPLLEFSSKLKDLSDISNETDAINDLIAFLNNTKLDTKVYFGKDTVLGLLGDIQASFPMNANGSRDSTRPGQLKDLIKDLEVLKSSSWLDMSQTKKDSLLDKIKKNPLLKSKTPASSGQGPSSLDLDDLIRRYSANQTQSKSPLVNLARYEEFSLAYAKSLENQNNGSELAPGHEQMTEVQETLDTLLGYSRANIITYVKNKVALDVSGSQFNTTTINRTNASNVCGKLLKAARACYYLLNAFVFGDPVREGNRTTQNSAQSFDKKSVDNFIEYKKLCSKYERDYQMPTISPSCAESLPKLPEDRLKCVQEFSEFQCEAQNPKNAAQFFARVRSTNAYCKIADAPAMPQTDSVSPEAGAERAE